MLKGFYLEEKSEKIDKIIVFLALIMIALVPIISLKKDIFSISPIVTNTSYATGEKMNVFNYYKSIAIYLFSGLIFSLFTYKVLCLEQKFRNIKVNILVGVFIISVVMSAIFADFKEIALLGNFDRNEGALAWFCYLAVFFVLYNINIESKYVKLFYYVLIPFCLINLILTILNIFGYDILKLDFVQMMLGGNGNIGGTLWTTLYHYNFMSGIGAVMFGVSFTYMLLEENTKIKFLIFLGTIVSVTIVLASNSIGGFITMLIIIPIILPLIWNLTNKKQILIWASITILVSTIIYILLNNKNTIVYQETFAIIEKLNGVSNLIIPIIMIIYIGLLFILSKVNQKKFFKYTTIVILSVVTITVGIYSLKIEKENKLIESGNKSVVRIVDKPAFKKLNEMSTDRLNIWTKTVDLINDKPVFGHGFDTFPYVFIPGDKNGGLSTYNEVIDKPHNWYLTVAYGGGLISLICLIGIIIYIARGVIYSSIDQVNNKYLYVFGIGVIAYAIQGMFNDSLVGTSIFFWIFAGICINRIASSSVE